MIEKFLNMIFLVYHVNLVELLHYLPINVGSTSTMRFVEVSATFYD